MFIVLAIIFGIAIITAIVAAIASVVSTTAFIAGAREDEQE